MEKLILRDKLFYIVEKHEEEGKTDFVIRWNTENYIYKSHFPGNPVTPGVCIIQISKEFANEIFAENLFIKKVKTVKFIKAINPITDNKVTFSILYSKKENIYAINAVVFDENNIFTKLSLELTSLKL